jgi:hypothetical protein
MGARGGAFESARAGRFNKAGRRPGFDLRHEAAVANPEPRFLKNRRPEVQGGRNAMPPIAGARTRLSRLSRRRGRSSWGGDFQSFRKIVRNERLAADRFQ